MLFSGKFLLNKSPARPTFRPLGQQTPGIKDQGAIAQLGERLNGIQEVGGSIPPGSTKFPLKVMVSVPAVAGTTIASCRCVSAFAFVKARQLKLPNAAPKLGMATNLGRIKKLMPAAEIPLLTKLVCKVASLHNPWSLRNAFRSGEMTDSMAIVCGRIPWGRSIKLG